MKLRHMDNTYDDFTMCAVQHMQVSNVTSTAASGCSCLLIARPLTPVFSRHAALRMTRIIVCKQGKEC